MYKTQRNFKQSVRNGEEATARGATRLSCLAAFSPPFEVSTLTPQGTLPTFLLTMGSLAQGSMIQIYHFSRPEQEEEGMLALKSGVTPTPTPLSMPGSTLDL